MTAMSPSLISMPEDPHKSLQPNNIILYLFLMFKEVLIYLFNDFPLPSL